MAKLRLLDLFCCAGGAARGYAQAGFTIHGIDKEPQKNFPYKFTQDDALSCDPRWIAANFDAVHASPPCQFGTALRHMPDAKEHLNLIPATRKLLKATGLPYVIENVEDVAKAGHLGEDPTLLCGTMFGLEHDGYELQRHRYFETNWKLHPPRECEHSGGPVIGVYGGHARCRSARHGGRGTKDKWKHGHKVAASEAMGIDWATLGEMSEAIPPAYTHWIGLRLKRHINFGSIL